MKNPTLLLNAISSNLEETIQHCASVIFKSTKYLGNGISVITTLETSPLITGIAKQQAAVSLGSSLCSRCCYASQTCHAPLSNERFNYPFPLRRKPRGFPKSHDKLEHFHSKKGTTFFSLPWEISALFRFAVISGRNYFLC